MLPLVPCYLLIFLELKEIMAEWYLSVDHVTIWRWFRWTNNRALENSRRDWIGISCPVINVNDCASATPK